MIQISNSVKLQISLLIDKLQLLRQTIKFSFIDTLDLHIIKFRFFFKLLTANVCPRMAQESLGYIAYGQNAYLAVQGYEFDRGGVIEKDKN